MPHPADLSKRPLQQKFRASSSPPLSQPTLARYGLTVRATVRACTFKNATATTQAKLTHGLSQTPFGSQHLSTHRLHRQAIQLRLAAIGVVGQGKESWPASADRRDFASRILNPVPRPTTFFSRPPDSVRGRGK